MTAEHNHPPRYCCTWDPEAPDNGGPASKCPGCPEHGEFAPRQTRPGHLVHSEAFIDQDDPRYQPNPEAR